ncbi:Protein Aster-B [Nowakowskiella sp. JEL0407]|nr:Protein Aster-B [Nowakowskiella sp. JEL0407]
MENIDQISKEGETIQPINQTPNVRSASLPMLANSLNSTSTLEPPQPSPGTIRTRTISANSVLSDPLLSTSKTSDSFPNGNLQQPHLKNPTITSIQQDPLTKFRAPSQFTNSTNVSVGDEVRLESPVGSINSPENDLKFSPQKRRTISSMSGVSVESSGTDWQLQNTDNEESWSVSNQQLLIPSKTNGKAEKLRAQELSASSPNTSLYREQKKFSKQFPELEKEVDSLHGIYSCALERDVLWQGKIYQTALHLAFYGKIFSKAAKVIIHFQDVYTIEKKSTAGMFPNAIRITTANTRYVFSSFLKRDSAFLDMIDAWKQVNPTAFENFKRAIDRKSELYDEDFLLSSSNPATMGTGKGILRKSTASAQNSPNTPLAASMLGDQVVVDDLEVSAYTDDDYSPMINVDVKNRKSTNSNLQQVTPTTNTDNSEANLLPKQNSNQLDALDPSSKGLNRSNTFSSSAKTFFKRMVTPTNTSADLDSGSPSTPYPKDETSEILLNVDSERNIVASPSPENVENSTTAVENEVPTTPSPLVQKETGGPPPNRPDDPSDCSCKPEEHPAALVLDETFNIDIRDLFLAIFADGGSGAVRGAHKRRETEPILFTNWETDNDGRWVTRELNYDVWFKAPMMAKQATPSIEKQNVIKQEELYYVVDAITKTPKVPYGDYFTVNNRYCLTHVAPGKSRLTIRATVDFIKKTMMKGTIESSAIEGITSYGRELSFVLREMEAKPDEPTFEKLTAHDAAMALNESSNTVGHNLEKFEPDTSARIEVKSSRSVLGLFVGIIVAVTIAIPWKVFKSLLMLIPGMGKLFVKETRYQTVLSPRQKKKSPRGVAPDGSAATSRRRNYIDPIDLRPDEDGDFLGIPKGVVLGIVGVVMFTVLFGFCFTIMNIRWMNNVEDRLQSALTKIQELQKEVVPSTPVYKGEETISGDVLYQRFVQESQRRIKRIQNSAGILDKKVEGVELQIGSLKWEVGEAIIDLAMVLISERDIEEKKKVETEK